MQQQDPVVWQRLLAIVASALGAVVIGASGYIVDGAMERIEILEGNASGQAISMANLSAQFAEHETGAKYWKKQIDHNRTRIEELSTDASSRPDAFTGTDGRTLRGFVEANERRIDLVERRADNVEAMRQRLDLVERNQRNYQSLIIPMIQQSNQLQMQRIDQDQAK